MVSETLEAPNNAYSSPYQACLSKPGSNYTAGKYPVLPRAFRASVIYFDHVNQLEDDYAEHLKRVCQVKPSHLCTLPTHQAMPPKSSKPDKDTPMYTIPIADRPAHGPLYSKIFFPILFNIGQIGINSAQILALPLLLIPFFGRAWFEGFIGWTKDGYGRLCTFLPNTLSPQILSLGPTTFSVEWRMNQERKTDE
jgi:hypothetical protein